MQPELLGGFIVAVPDPAEGIEGTAAVAERALVCGSVGQCKIPNGGFYFFFKYNLVLLVNGRDGRCIFARRGILLGSCSDKERLLKPFLKLGGAAPVACVGHGDKSVGVFAVIDVAQALDLKIMLFESLGLECVAVCVFEVAHRNIDIFAACGGGKHDLEALPLVFGKSYVDGFILTEGCVTHILLGSIGEIVNNIGVLCRDSADIARGL